MIPRDQFTFDIPADAFRYLVIQRGDISDLCPNPVEWESAYHASMFETYESIAPFLPQSAGRILDIGSGLGGIDVLLNKHYGSKVEICPLDGLDDPALVVKHGETFSSEAVTRAFLNRNGVGRVHYFAANALPPPRPFPLIVSFASWCFHYPPGRYLHFVKACLRHGGRLIVDVRREKSDWRSILAENFQFIGIAHKGKKFDRLVYQG